ncbi:hypothetical protein [Rummeliibacillus pycnus]|uniref:hypothetical protein n=1 Tax=Rummeliibacillus pycnus TaxID=101070 RepID=UPI000C99D63D|nr:hypothetical protein [Rummeliibacillus pycnus]
MNEVEFRSLVAEERVKYVNDYLMKNMKLKEVAINLGIAYSSMTSLLNKDGYRYSRQQKQYVPLEGNDNKGEHKEEDVLLYIKENEATLRRIIEFYNSASLIISPKVYDNGAKFVTKNFKINTAILNEFQTLMSEKYPQYRLQDAISQAILDFIGRYK